MPVAQLELLNKSETPPFVVSSDEPVDENVRLKYRYLDLRRTMMQHNLTLRHRIVKTLRDYFDDHDFIEVETPMLIKSTPEGARDYLVPSRIYPGTFYALPQSPQILKQMLMIGGIGRYMQIARCLRDEDPRADRQPEFTQIDVEMSFVTEDDVIAMMEGSIRDVWFRALDHTIGEIPQLTYHEAIRRFGSDKPDLRFGLELVDVAELFRDSDFKLFHTLAETPGNRVIALRYPGGAALSRRDFDALTETAKLFGAKGMAYITLADDGAKGPIVKFLGEPPIAALRAETMSEDRRCDPLRRRTGARSVGHRRPHPAGDRRPARPARSGGVQVLLGARLPALRARSPTAARSRSPIIRSPRPAPGQEAALRHAIRCGMRAQHYDLVLNGYELGSGSIRNHKRREQQQEIFVCLGLSDGADRRALRVLPATRCATARRRTAGWRWGSIAS